MIPAKYGAKPKPAVAVFQYARPAGGAPLAAEGGPAKEGGAGKAAPQRYRVQGKRASDLEDRVYRMLRALGWRDDDIQFQVKVMGGRRAGGALLDFVIWAPGMPIVIEPNGDHWHTATLQQRQRDLARTAAIQEAWARPFRYLALPQGEILTDEMAYQKLLIAVGRG